MDPYPPSGDARQAAGARRSSGAIAALAVTSRRDVASCLGRLPLELSAVGDVRQALEAAREHSYELVIVELASQAQTLAALCELAADKWARAIPAVAILPEPPGPAALERLLAAGASEAFGRNAPPPALEARIAALVRARRLYLEALEQSLRDELTGLYNRRFFSERLAQEAARADRYRLSIACVVADLDGLKEINDSLGHAAGDAALVAVAQVFARRTRRSDVAVRLGGDEFAVLLSPNTELGARRYAELARREVAELALEELGGRRLTISLGCALYPSAAVSDPLTQLVPAADAALIEAKRRGRDRVVLAGQARGATAHGAP